MFHLERCVTRKEWFGKQFFFFFEGGLISALYVDHIITTKFLLTYMHISKQIYIKPFQTFNLASLETEMQPPELQLKSQIILR